MGEGEDRELDPELLGHFGLHLDPSIANVGANSGL
jgi:hypothetical protein